MSREFTDSDRPRPEPLQAPPGTPMPTAAPSADTSEKTPGDAGFSLAPTVAVNATDTKPTTEGYAPGSVLSGYVIIETIGRGGMGIVYKAKQPQTEQTVALKRMRDGIFADQDVINRFLQEVRALGRVHPAKNIVPIFHADQDGQEPFYVMPFLSGGSVAKQIQRYKNDQTLAVALVEKVARAVHQLHQHQILHRDIKPANILLDGDGEPYLGDFGLAKFLDHDASLSVLNQRLGTPAYMAPEQTGLIRTAASAQTDVWALGAVLYELVVGRRPFPMPDDRDTAALLYSIVNDAPPRPCSVQPEIDPGLEAVILKCLEKKPSDRFASAAELADELSRWLNQEKLQTPPITLFYWVRRFARRNAAALAVATVLLVTIAVAAVAYRRTLPDSVHEAIRGELIDKGEVTLIGAKGGPRWSENPLGSKMNFYVDERDGLLRVEAFDVGLVELLRDMPFEAFILRAEIRHEKANEGQGFKGLAGLFVGRQFFDTDGPPRHFWCEWVYNDIRVIKIPDHAKAKLKPQPGNPAILRYRVHCPIVSVDEPLNTVPPVFFEPAGVKAFRWRTLEIEVHDDRFLARFDGNATSVVKRETHDAYFVDYLKRRQEKFQNTFGLLGDPAPLKLSPRGSVGLIVSDSTVAVRNITVRSLNPR